MKFLPPIFAAFSFTLILAHADEASVFEAHAGASVTDTYSVAGQVPGWFFLRSELQHIATGPFWKKPWEEVAVNGGDPIASMVEFNTMLSERGVELLIVPVPAKAHIYPEKLKKGATQQSSRSLAPLYEKMREAGLKVLDLETPFLEEKQKNPNNILYCKQDAHFSPYAAAMTASFVAEAMGFPKTGEDAPSAAEVEPLSFVGDLIRGSEWEGLVPPETVPVQYAFIGGNRLVETDPSSPILFLGDSHTLVFQAGSESGMHCSGAGVADHLARFAGGPIDMVGVSGSGLVQARKQLFYHATGIEDYWAGKKKVVWLFSVRELTQSRDKLIRIPLDR